MWLYMKRTENHLKQINPIYPYENFRLAQYLDSLNFKDYLYSQSFTTPVRTFIECNMRTMHGLEACQINTLFALMMIKSGVGTAQAVFSGFIFYSFFLIYNIYH